MGTLSLTCPFCCDEIFTSHHSLKYHILSITDNLTCPACDVRFYNISELAEHLGRECKENELEFSRSITVEGIKSEATQDQCEPIEDENTNNTSISVAFLKTEPTDEEENNGILADASLCNVPYTTEHEQSVNAPSYMCQVCNVQFNSIEEHLDKFHDGEEVILETEDTSQFETNEQESEEVLNEIVEDEVHEVAENDSVIERPVNETVEEQHYLDKDGRLYTRKVVKIDKFWVDQNVNNDPLTENYVLENGKVRKITEEEADDIIDKNSIIQIHQCPICYLQFPNLDHYLKHKCDPTKIKNKFKCIHCKGLFHNYQSLNAHMKTHITKDSSGKIKRVVTLGPHTCEICNTMFPSFKSLRLHQRMHDPVKNVAPDAPVSYSISGNVDESKEVVRHMFICSVCNKTYDKEYEEIHMKSHIPSNNFDCILCNRKFFTKENLEMHTKAHSNGKKFMCSYCKKPFATYEGLEDHVTNQCQKRQYECQYCGRRFSRPHEKVKHERIHTGEKPHVCQVCGKSFRVSYCLTLHLRTHSGTRPYQCIHCRKRFKSHSVYNHHLLTHSDVRAYKCTFCPKAFKTSVQLAGHRNSHTKPFTCTECNRPFASLYAVRAHMETHKRENNLKFDCWLCGATYARAFALRDHMRSQHADENIEEAHNSALVDLETAESTNRIENEMITEDAEQIEDEET